MSKTCEKLNLWVELTQAGNIHYHGLIIIKDLDLYYIRLKSFIDNVGFITIKPFVPKDGRDGKEVWIEYMGKTQEMMERILGITFPLLLNDWIIADAKKSSAKFKAKLREGNIIKYIKCVSSLRDQTSDSD